jgi:hypothetical protein
MRRSQKGWIELRVHGVGGSPGEALLGTQSSPTSTLSTVGPGTGMWRRNDGSGIEGYDWGHLSSSSPMQALWIFLLPFTLVNVAGQMAPVGLRRATRKVVAVHSLVVRALGLCLTFTWTVWLAVVLVDLVGLQWFRRIGAVDGVANWLHLSPDSSALVFGWAGMLLGLIATAAIMWVLRGLAGGRVSAPRTNQATAPRTTDPSKSGLADPRFFDEPHLTTLVAWHVGIVLVPIGTIALAIFGLSEDDRLYRHLGIGGLLLCAWLFQAILVGALFLFALIWGEGGIWRRLSTSSGSAGALACVLTNSFFASLLFLLVKYLLRWPKVSRNGVVQSGLLFYEEHSLTDVWLKSLIIAVALMLVLSFVVSRRARVTLPTPTPDEPWFGAAVRKGSTRAQRAAAVGHAAPKLISVIGIVTYVLAVAAAINRLQVHGWNVGHARLRFGNTTWMNVAAVLLPVGLGALIVFVRRAATSSPTRRLVGTIWDVLTFWPRDYHPLAVRCSAAQIVPEIEARLADSTDAQAGFLVSAHSQGSVLAYAALQRSPDDVVGRVCLVTYGSPLVTIYEQMFPAYFGGADREVLFSRLFTPESLPRWRNYYRLTDPIGGPVGWSEQLSTVDQCLADPQVGSLVVEPMELFTSPPEMPRPRWGLVARHSQYLAEEDVQIWVDEIRSMTPHR